MGSAREPVRRSRLHRRGRGRAGVAAWLVLLATIAFANALVVLGRGTRRAGLVPLGKALFDATGPNAVALLSP